MTRRMILMRHAKSDWSTPAAGDHARPLNDRGRRSAAALGTWLRDRGWLPDRVLCSTAARTRETLTGLRLDAPVRFEQALYHAAPDTMLDLLRGAKGDCVLMIGHNPGIAFFAQMLAAAPPAHARFADYPTGATTVMEFAADDWPGAAPGSGKVLDFAVPRELPGV